MADHNFDNIAQKFVKNIYGSTKGKIRSEIVWSELLHCLSLLPQRPLRILDAGGGFGFFTQKLAALGHQVVLCDISGELLKEAQQQLNGQAYAENVEILHCSIQNLPEHCSGKFDLILNHAVLEWLADPKQTLQGLLSFLCADGLLSLMFYNKEAQRFFNLVSGNFDFVAKGMVRKKVVRLTPTYPLLETDIKMWLDEFEMQILQKTGVRVLHDYLKESSHCEEKFAQLLEMEKQYCHQEPYASLGRYTHLTVKGKNS
ncbi:methyltransferase domain-containing protein [Psychromonas aquimarina]|uniref:methyltransferase domain-containing protein n=1 Tax=Psychromonas aquimarina TaxID=444919 RepID=UPI0004274E30|nr:methyltransferase domain-containing protein [Psychromonas aquimarina]